MNEDLLKRLRDKYPEYFIQHASNERIDISKEKFMSLNITPHIDKNGSVSYRLRRISTDGTFVYTSWHENEKTILENLLNLEL